MDLDSNLKHPNMDPAPWKLTMVAKLRPTIPGDAFSLEFIEGLTIQGSSFTAEGLLHQRTMGRNIKKKIFHTCYGVS